MASQSFTAFIDSSWPGHKFIVKELPSRDGICEYTGDQSCRQVHFTTPDSGAQSIRITPNFDVIFSNPLASNATTESPHELVASCHQRIKDRLSLDSSIHNSTSASTAVVLQALEDCVKRELVGIMERFQEDLSFHSSRRTNMAIDLENYTCLDAQMTSSSGDVYTKTWTNNNKKHLVHVKLDRPASRIHVIDDFISEEECRYVESALDGPLKRAIIADGKGGATYLSSRKSLQAIISVDWTSENGEGITANLFRRVYNYTTHVLGLNVNERGQELPAVIQVRMLTFLISPMCKVWHLTADPLILHSTTDVGGVTQSQTSTYHIATVIAMADYTGLASESLQF
jgi:hypothetical protein